MSERPVAERSLAAPRRSQHQTGWRAPARRPRRTRHGVRPLISVDNTFLGPLLQNPLEHGADYTVTSLSYVVSLLPPDDALFRALIVKFCADRQMAVDESVVSYLATRIERSYAAARRAVELLDSEALRLGRPVTRALAAELLRKA